MNGFANAILTLLLSWMRVLVNDLWRLLSSEDAGLFYRFLAANWKVIVLILCAGGFVIDRIVYLIRWRPYYVWSSRLGRLKRARAARHGDVYPEEDAIPPEEEPSASPDGQEVPFPDDSASYAPDAFDQAYPQDFGATRAYAPAQDFAPGSQAPAMNQAPRSTRRWSRGRCMRPIPSPISPRRIWTPSLMKRRNAGRRETRWSALCGPTPPREWIRPLARPGLNPFSPSATCRRVLLRPGPRKSCTRRHLPHPPRRPLRNRGRYIPAWMRRSSANVWA